MILAPLDANHLCMVERPFCVRLRAHVCVCVCVCRLAVERRAAPCGCALADRASAQETKGHAKIFLRYEPNWMQKHRRDKDIV